MHRTQRLPHTCCTSFTFPALPNTWFALQEYSIVGNAEMDFKDFNIACCIAERWKSAKPAAGLIGAVAAVKELRETKLDEAGLRLDQTVNS